MNDMYTIPNLQAQLVEKNKPWEADFKLPEFGNATEYKQWASLPNTRYMAFSAVEGTDPTQRVSPARNEPRRIHGVVGDWDARFSDDEFDEFMKRNIDGAYPCAWVSRSYSGGIHAVWSFETPLLAHNQKTSKRLLARISKELGLDKLARGFDKPAFTDVAKYYLLGHDWRKVGASPIPSSTLHYWQYETSVAGDFEGDYTEVDLDVVKAEVDRQFAGAWTGVFKDGARGKRFWDPTADNPTAAIVRTGGMQCFTGAQPFVSWAEILGPEFVSQFEIGRIGAAIEQYWFDGRGYYIREESGRWLASSKDETTLDLRCRHNLSARRGRNEATTEVERALFHIHVDKRIEAAIPFVYDKRSVVDRGGKSYFNTATVRPSSKADTRQKWGKNFPLTAEWLEVMFGEEQLPHELGWLHHAYSNAYDGNPGLGQAQFLVGPPNCGKTLYNCTVLADLFGGHIKASEFLTGKTDFNNHLFDQGLWTVDDEAPAASTAMHTSFTAKVKEFVANSEFICNTKFQKAGRVFWRGRLSVTLNSDPVSMRLLPDLDMSIRDKVMVFQCGKYDAFDPGFRAKVRAEMPYFARYLYDYKIPDDRTDVRFGVKAYLNPEIDRRASVDSRYAYIIELLDIFRKSYFTGDEAPWEGTCSELLLHLHKMTGVSNLMRDINAKKLGWGLSHLASKGCDWLERSDIRGSYQWVITSQSLEQE